MKKLFLLPLIAAAMFLGATPASSTQVLEIPSIPGPTPQLKVDICHNGTIVPVSINAVLTAQDTGHGLLTLLPGLPPSFTFVAHVEGQGHASDTVLRIYLKAGNTETNIVVASGTCDAPPPPPPDPLVRVCIEGEVQSILTSIQVQLGLTVLGDNEVCPVPEVPETPDPVIVEVPVEKIVEVPGPTMVIERTITTPAPPAPAAPPAAAPTGELPRTGGSPFLLMLGSGVTAAGVVLRRLFK